ncbi:MAG: hypothetical protein JO142_01215, partial [Burkholderiales bacterium]|nr:hypothetical protein [Burkholderiales bacterium]
MRKSKRDAASHVYPPSRCAGYIVSPQRPRLTADLESGLIAAEKDGKLKALFDRYFSATLKQLNVASRTIIALKNPLLPTTAPLQHREY